MYTTIIRTIITFFLIIFTMRLMGKRQIGELQPFELVVTIIVSELASLPIVDSKIPLLYGIIPIITLILLEVMISFIQMKFEKTRILFSSHPSILIKNGYIDFEEMKKQKFNIDDLLEELRLEGYFNIEDIEFAILETCGELSIIPKTELTPPTKKDMNIHCTQDTLPLTLVVDGKIREYNLKLAEKDEKWLINTIQKQGHKDIKDIILALLDCQGELYIQGKNDSKKQNNNQEKSNKNKGKKQ
ncbi:DUF421 domain-containing protein [Clostridium cellulovorans]|uniref:YetF C-terminal domain-containing protein n=1 Tax=Clostridium cellulovorans (strain ATCC 35296 / DSM 3052 / OCM 3 / 743B) TaxID=573061 RepID=D9SRU2_CLOC7|nr:DUF421 domain-containing protein [Clostridium cellulovorans]ADL50459.1 protein of unknown function DUF421 [Clostridium cellulovorans 743B]